MSSSSYQDFLAEALSRMQADGLDPDPLYADGELHRCPVDGKPQQRDGAYVIFSDSTFPAAWWRNWTSGVTDTYCAKSRSEMSAKERKQLKEWQIENRRKAELEYQKALKAGANAARQLWNTASPVNSDEHPYLRAKGVSGIGLAIDARQQLLVPAFNADGQIQALSRIPANPIEGSWKKFFLGKAGGCYFPIKAKDGSSNRPLLIGEGYCTCASAHLAANYETWVAFDCGNLDKVGKLARQIYPTRKICFLADYDVAKNEKMARLYPDPGGIGVAKARAAAIAIGGYLAICPPIDGGAADFNDLHQRDGLLAVQDVIEQALAGDPVTTCPDPAGFRMVARGQNAGLYFEKPVKDSFPQLIRIGPPIEIVGETRDTYGEDRGLLLRWLDSEGIQHSWAMPMTMLYSYHGEWICRLASGGWYGHPGYKKQIGEYFASARPLRHIRCVNKVGWHGDYYVLPNAHYGPGDEDIFLQSPCHNGLYTASGTLEDWKEIPKLCVGNPIFGFALCCAFAGPLLRLAGMDGGVFSFEGGSSSGKTTALRLAASVWGDATHLRSWRATSNALEGLATLSNDNCLILDELSQVAARDLDAAIYSLPNGSGKSRASKDGSLRTSQSWQALILSSGELGIASKLAEDGRKARAGQEVRFCGIEVTKDHIRNLHGYKDAAQLADRVKELCALHYGHAGRAFLQQLTRPDTLARARNELRHGIDEQARAICPAGSDSQVMRVARRFMLAGVAGELAKGMGILPEGFAAMDFAKGCFHNWLEERGGLGAAEDMAILAQVKLFIQQHGNSRFQDYERLDQPCYNRVGIRKDGIYYCFPEAFEAEIIKGYSLKLVLNVLRNAGWLVLGVQSRNKTRLRIKDEGRVDMYAIRPPEN